MSNKIEIQWGVEYCFDDAVNSEVEIHETKASAEKDILDVRRRIEAGAWDAKDYEPMRVVTRQVTTTITSTVWTDPR